MLRIHNVKVPLEKKNYKKILSQKLNVREKQIHEVKLIKKSLDARRQNIHWICSFDFQVDHEDQILKQHPEVTIAKEYQYHYYPANDQHVMVIGSGPSGLFCAYVLSEVGQKVTVIERGKRIEERIQDVENLLQNGQLDPESNISFGEGGAGTFSDGKLTTGIKNSRLRYILETFVKHGAPEDILYLSKPHIGTDYLRQVIMNMRKHMEKNGVTFLFESQMVDFDFHDGFDVHIKHNDQIKRLKTDRLVLAIGHSARDTYRMLYRKGLEMTQKAFAVGVRLEQFQKDIDQIQYKKWFQSPELKAASYKLAVKTKDGRGVYTFCMCPGGFVVPSQHEEETICVNGMSYYDRSGDNANSAILVNVQTSDFKDEHPLSGIDFQEELERKAYELGGSKGFAPIQLVDDYMNNQITKELKDLVPTYRPGYTFANLNLLFPEFINQALKEGFMLMNDKMNGFINEHSVITGVESRSSSPVRLLRNQSYQSSIPYLYPIGEGAGYAGGIMSSAVDGIMAAEMILKEE